MPYGILLFEFMLLLRLKNYLVKADGLLQDI